MAVVTISRQMGSMGCQVAGEIARILNYRVVWREVINEAAKRAGVPEVALATIDELDLLGIRPSLQARKAYQDAVEVIMHELAAEGNVVIVGRAGQVILQGMRNTFHVRIFAPFELRVARTAEVKQVSEETARAQVKASDQARTLYLKKYYHAHVDDPEYYDLLLNTAQLSVESAAAVVCTLVVQRQNKAG
jgi:cytidylate kinase